MRVAGAPTLSPLFMARLSRRGPLPEPLDGPGVRTYYQARYAIWHALRALGLKPGDNVLLPAFHCSTELDACVDLRIDARFYGVDDALRVRIDALERAVDERTRAVLVIHYFGLPQEIGTIAEYCRRSGLRLIEDCAHTLRGLSGGRPLGTFGDVSIFSMRKLLPLPDGGALRINDPAIRLPAQPAAEPPVRGTLGEVRRSLSRNLELQQGPVGRAVAARVLRPVFVALKTALKGGRGRPARAEDPYDFLPERIHWSMSSLSRGILRGTSLDEVGRTRRENFGALAARIRPTPHLRPLASGIPGDACPWVFPVLVDRPQAFIAHMVGRGIEVSEFWQRFRPVFPRDRFPRESDLKERVLALPVHHQLGVRDMEWIAEAAVAWNGAAG